jgi:hypothetical protein
LLRITYPPKKIRKKKFKLNNSSSSIHPGYFFKTIVMEDNTKHMELLLERAIDYGKTSFELVKLKALDKTSDAASSLVPHSVVFLMISSFMLFLSLGIALWLGEILGMIWVGFFLVAALYGLIGIVIHFFMHKWIKKTLCNLIIKQVLK